MDASDLFEGESVSCSLFEATPWQGLVWGLLSLVTFSCLHTTTLAHLITIEERFACRTDA